MEGTHGFSANGWPCELRNRISEKLSHGIPEDGLRKMKWWAECLLSMHKVTFLVSRPRKYWTRGWCKCYLKMKMHLLTGGTPGYFRFAESELTPWFAFHRIPVTLEMQLTSFPRAAFV